jgi:hypothetical protein
MQGTAWVGLFRRIPASLHDCLVVMTTTGQEIVLQRIIRLERDFLVALGRLSGSTDQAKVLVLPFDQMTYLSFGKKLTDEELQGALGNADLAVANAAASEVTETPAEEIVDMPREPAFASEAAAPTPQPAAGAAAATPQPAAGAPAKPVPKKAPPSKTVLLARLRERLANEIARQPGS